MHPACDSSRASRAFWLRHLSLGFLDNHHQGDSSYGEFVNGPSRSAPRFSLNSTEAMHSTLDNIVLSRRLRASCHQRQPPPVNRRSSVNRLTSSRACFAPDCFIRRAVTANRYQTARSDGVGWLAGDARSSQDDLWDRPFGCEVAQECSARAAVQTIRSMLPSANNAGRSWT